MHLRADGVRGSKALRLCESEENSVLSGGSAGRESARGLAESKASLVLLCVR